MVKQFIKSVASALASRVVSKANGKRLHCSMAMKSTEKFSAVLSYSERANIVKQIYQIK